MCRQGGNFPGKETGGAKVGAEESDCLEEPREVGPAGPRREGSAAEKGQFRVCV